MSGFLSWTSLVKKISPLFYALLHTEGLEPQLLRRDNLLEAWLLYAYKWKLQIPTVTADLMYKVYDLVTESHNLHVTRGSALYLCRRHQAQMNSMSKHGIGFIEKNV